MDFEDFILAQLVRRDIAFDAVSCRFDHPHNDLAHPDIACAIYEEGIRRELFESEIDALREEVVNHIHRYSDHSHPTVQVIRLGKDLRLGGLAKVQATLCTEHSEVQLLLLLVGRQNFLVVESSRPEMFHEGVIYVLQDKNYLSSINSNSSTPFCFCNDCQSSIMFNISCLNVIRPSRIEVVLDGKNAPRQRTASFTLHKNPMTLLMHDFSQHLPQYVDLNESQTVLSEGGIQQLENLSELISDVQTSIVDNQSVDSVAQHYIMWLQYCQNSAVPIMALDQIVNLFWRIRN